MREHLKQGFLKHHVAFVLRHFHGQYDGFFAICTHVCLQYLSKTPSQLRRRSGRSTPVSLPFPFSFSLISAGPASDEEHVENYSVAFELGYLIMGEPSRTFQNATSHLRRPRSDDSARKGRTPTDRDILHGASFRLSLGTTSDPLRYTFATQTNRAVGSYGRLQRLEDASLYVQWHGRSPAQLLQWSGQISTRMPAHWPRPGSLATLAIHCPKRKATEQDLVRSEWTFHVLPLDTPKNFVAHMTAG
jgi:hypothetical protein